jgi:crotonobetaine/carnitine-CoA ligase
VRRILLADRDEPEVAALAPEDGYEIRGYDVVHRADPVDGRIPDPADIGTIMFTSGTTGRSKAVLLPHNQFCRGAAHLAEAFELTDRDVFHGWMPLYHIGGQLHMTMTAVVAGASMGIIPRFSAATFWAQVRALRATVFGGFPNVLRILWAMPERPDDYDCPLRLGICGTIPPDLHRPFEQRFGVRLVDTYGMTEAEPLTIPVTGVECPRGSCGKAGPDFEVVVLDDHDREVPTRQVGEIAVRPIVPDVIMHGYEGDEAATAEVWRSGWFHTGDLGRKDEEGNIYWIDRKKHTIRRRGENISSWELEQILAAHPDIAQCAVVGVASPLGEEDVKAMIVPRKGAAPDPSEIHTFCTERMARFMVPRYIEIRSELPRSEIGKVQKELLRETTPQTWDAESGRDEGST